jgi:hypothetical protein
MEESGQSPRLPSNMRKKALVTKSDIKNFVVQKRINTKSDIKNFVVQKN